MNPDFASFKKSKNDRYRNPNVKATDSVFATATPMPVAAAAVAAAVAQRVGTKTDSGNEREARINRGGGGLFSTENC